MVMGLVRLPNYKLFWSTHHLLSLNIASIMPRDRFMNIINIFTHVTIQLSHPCMTPTIQSQPFSKMLIRNWRHGYTPCRDVSIDECLGTFKGISKHMKYIPSKPHKWGAYQELLWTYVIQYWIREDMCG